MLSSLHRNVLNEPLTCNYRIEIPSWLLILVPAAMEEDRAREEACVGPHVPWRGVGVVVVVDVGFDCHMGTIMSCLGHDVCVI